MPKITPEVEAKRLQLKKELFNLLLEHRDGILKINVWTMLRQKSFLNLNNSEFRVGSMDALFKLYEDMVHEEHVNGKTYICLNQHFSWEQNPQLQQRAMKTMVFEKSSPQSLLGPVSRQGGQRSLDTSNMLSWPHLGTASHAQQAQARSEAFKAQKQQQQQHRLPSDAFISQQITAATQSIQPFRTSTLGRGGHPPTLLPAPPLMKQPDYYATPSTSKTSSASHSTADSDESDDHDDESSESEDNEGETGGGTLAYSLIKSRLVDILQKYGPMKQGKMLSHYQRLYQVPLKFHSGLQFKKMYEKFSDAIEKYKPNPNTKSKRVRVKPSYIKQSNQQWGQGVGQDQGQVIDLTSDNVIDLTADSGIQKGLTSGTNQKQGPTDNSNFISLEMNPSPSTSSHHASRSRDHSLERNKRHQSSQEIHPQTVQTSISYGSLYANAKPINKKHFDEVELNVAPVRKVSRYAQPTRDQVDNVAQECIEILAESNCFVSNERVEKLLMQRFQIHHLSQINVRYIDQIGSVHEHNRLMSKVTAYIQAFMKVRCICTLYELKECLKDFSLAKDSFAKLNIGPLQRLPIVYQMFKFPPDMEEIPEITTLDILEHLRNYLTQKNKWTERADLEDFMKYLVEQYDADDAFQLGVRIRSLPLGLQVLKKAQREAGQSRRSVTDGFKEQLRKDIETVFQKFRMTVIHTTADGTWEVRNHYLRLRPEMAIMEIFQKYKLIMSMDEPSTKSEKKKHQKLENAVNTFLECVRDDVMSKTLFHLAICVSNSVLEESAMEILAPPEKESETGDKTAVERVKPPKAMLVESLKKYLDRCLQRGTMTLSLLDKIEEKLAEESNFPSFAEIGYGRFLQFTLQEAKGQLEECGGTSLGSGSGGSDTNSGYKPTHLDILSFIHQCLQCGRDQEEYVDVALCNQFNVKEVKDLGYGKTGNLMAAANKPGQHKYQEHSVVFEVAVGTDLRKNQESKIGILGHQTKEAALACLHNCPLMEDMATWSHWSLVFEPELGKLKDFVQKYGGSNTIPFDGGKKLFTYHVTAMETKPGVLLKLTSNTSTELFEEALSTKHPRNVCGQLMSLIVANKGLTNSPLALLANQMRSHLFTMHASDASNNLPGAPPSDNHTDEAVKFVLKCLIILPVKSCVSLANQIFLEPLGQVVGSSTSKFQLLSACETAEETNRLQELGCLLGVGEWTSQIQQKCQIMMSDMEIVPEEEADMIVLDDYEESDAESESPSEASSLSSILSDGDDDDVQIVSVDKVPEVKKEPVKKDDSMIEISTGEEDTADEPENNLDMSEFTVLDEVKEEEKDEKETKEEDTTITITEEEKEESKEKIEESDDSDEMEIMTEEERLQKECEKVVNTIRREEFGIGIELNEDGQRLKKVQDERLGRSLDRLSKDLYSKDTHFVLELIQNADDNDYAESIIKDGQLASVKFVMQTEGVIVLNNETGFMEKNIRALCDVGRSTKGKHKFGYIGQKGIGFKSVFRVTDRPEVHSKGYHICFDTQSGPMGYILPHWIEDTWDIGKDENAPSTVSSERKFLVFENKLLELFEFCPSCTSPTLVDIKQIVGSMVKVHQNCGMCGYNRIWDSQPMAGAVPAGNLLMSAAILFSGMKKKLMKIAKEKECDELNKWIRSICNHMYWVAASTPDGNGQIMLQKWQSVANHVTNVHEHKGELFPTCQHGPLEGRERKKKWLKPGTKVCEKVQDLVLSRQVTKDVQKLSPGPQTAVVEGYHSIVNHFAPKMIGFSYHGMKSSWTTKIILPLKEEMMVHMRSLAARFNDIHPSLLLFLHRLREITIDNRVENSSQVMRRTDLGNNIVEIEHNNGVDKWLVVKKMLDASKISLQAKSGVEVESTEIALAFPLSEQYLLSKVMPPKQPVFAFLPLRSYGFRFIIQADFDVPSSREDVDRDSAWNQWIRNEIHKLFLEALEVFKNHEEFKGMKALIAYLQFIPMEDEILDFFRPVSTQILKQVRAKPCLPTQPNNKGIISWKLPTQVVTVKDSLVREVVTPEFLQKHLDLFYLHREVADMLNPTLIQCLGIESLTTNHLIQIGKVLSTGQQDIDPDAKIILMSKWLACVYRSLDEFHDNQEVYDTLRKMKIVPLASKEYVALEDNTVFFPLSATEQRSRSQHRDPMAYLQEDMNTIHPWFLSVPDNEVNSQVQKLLTKLSVCQLSPHDVINRHILPVLKSNIWKTKKRDILISYLIYIKEQTEKDSSLVNMDDLADVAILMTNHGEKNPKRDNVHFTPFYGNRFNLPQTFPGYDWCLIDGVYLQNVNNNADKQRWHRFFSRLGVTDFITVRPVQVELDSESVKESPWAPLQQLHPEDFSKGCIIEDFSCDEIRDLLKFNKAPQSYELQMKFLCEYLDQFWDTQFTRYTKTKLVQKESKQEREVESSFSIWLKNLDWLPAIEVKTELDSNGVIHYKELIHRMTPSSLYYPFNDITRCLSYTVMYVDVQFNVDKSTFAKFLGLKFEISLEDLISSLKKWGQRSDDDSPSIFVTSHDHIHLLYNYLGENLNKKQIQDLLDKDPVIFFPVKFQSIDFGDLTTKPRFKIDTAGQMLCRQEVWWEEKTGLFQKYHDILTEIHADVGKKKILSSYMKYAKSQSLQDFFKTGRIQIWPDVEDYAELLVHVASAQSRVEQNTLEDVMKILSMIGELLNVQEDDPEFETKKLIIEGKKKKILNLFKGQNIIPTKRRIWTSLENNPLMADNKEYEQIFQEKHNVHFVLLEENIRKGKETGAPSYHVTMDSVMQVLRMCGVEDLSAVVEEEIITELFQPCPRLQVYMGQCVPLLQKFLYNNYAQVYRSWLSAGMTTTLSKLYCIETNKLEVRYWFKSDPDIYVILPESCTLKNEQFIVHRDSVESYGEINKVIARIFSKNNNNCFRELRNFLTDIQSIITRQTNETLERCEWRYNANKIDESEELWIIPAPIIPEPEPEPIVEPEEMQEEYTEDDVIIVGSDQSEQGSKPMKAWPPMSHDVEKAFPPRTRTKREDQGESKVWPPPKAPDYMKSVKDLPSGVKVVYEGERPEEGEAASQYATQVFRSPEKGENNTGQGQQSSSESGERSTQQTGEGERPNLPRISQDGKSTSSQSGQEHGPIVTSEAGAGTSHSGSHEGHPTPHASQGHPTSSGGELKGDGHSRTHQGENTSGHSHHDGPMKEYGGESGGKRRHVSGGSDSNSQPSAKRPAHRIGMPVWEKELGEYEEEELASGEKLKLPPGMIFDSSKSEMPEIGRLGELTVYQYLLKELDENPNVSYVNWCNEDEELGQPYDFEVGVTTEDEVFTVYIEVKSTISNTKEIFEISYPQIKFAQENKDRFHVYRIFNACNPDNVRLVRIQNLGEKINEKQVKLCLII